MKKEYIDVLVRINGRKTWKVIGTISKMPDEKLDLGKVIEQHFRKSKRYGK